MAYTALYRKYRPTNFANVVGQDSIVEILKNSLKFGCISHAYLFAGPRGTGKTSVAKIFARAVNCQNFTDDLCGTCQSCNFLLNNDTDIIEIDAASNNGVDEIRTLRENVKLLPTLCKYKIYIIDEVHMLSTGAFNALLKTLEEPPSHVIFILATTDPNKIPITILSRCQRFDFNKIDSNALNKRLKFILQNENKELTEDVIERIANVSDGGLRDAINLLDQVLSISNKLISPSIIDDLCGKISSSLIKDFFYCFIESNYRELLININKISKEGKNFFDLVNSLLIVLRDASVIKFDNTYFDADYVEFLEKLNLSSDIIYKISHILNELNFELKNTSDQKILFEIYAMRIIEIINTQKSTQETYTHQSVNINMSINTESINKNKNTDEKEILNIDFSNADEFAKLKSIRINNVLAEANKNLLNNIISQYDQLNDYISSKTYNKLASLLLDGKVVVASPKYLLFIFKDSSLVSLFDLNYKQIELFLNEVFGIPYKVVAILDCDWKIEKEKFIFNKNNNISYVLLEENDVELKKSSDDFNELQDSALNIFGEDTVSVK